MAFHTQLVNAPISIVHRLLKKPFVYLEIGKKRADPETINNWISQQWVFLSNFKRKRRSGCNGANCKLFKNFVKKLHNSQFTVVATHFVWKMMTLHRAFFPSFMNFSILIIDGFGGQLNCWAHNNPLKGVTINWFPIYFSPSTVMMMAKQNNNPQSKIISD